MEGRVIRITQKTAGAVLVFYEGIIYLGPCAGKILHMDGLCEHVGTVTAVTNNERFGGGSTTGNVFFRTHVICLLIDRSVVKVSMVNSVSILAEYRWIN